MYNLSYFKEKNQETVLQFMRQHPFVFLTGCDKDSKPVATQVPVFIDEKEGKLFLTGHMMRQTDHHKAFEQNNNVLAVFNGPHTYVSATWYDNPHQASTWNYMSVHAKGIINFQNENYLADVLRRLTLHYEDNNPASSTVFDNLPEDYRNRLMKAIVPFEIEIMEIDNVFKLSQNHNEKTFKNIIERLDQQGGDGKLIAEEMRKRQIQLFTP